MPKNHISLESPSNPINTLLFLSPHKTHNKVHTPTSQRKEPFSLKGGRRRNLIEPLTLPNHINHIITKSRINKRPQGWVKLNHIPNILSIRLDPPKKLYYSSQPKCPVTEQKNKTTKEPSLVTKRRIQEHLLKHWTATSTTSSTSPKVLWQWGDE